MKDENNKVGAIVAVVLLLAFAAMGVVCGAGTAALVLLR